jgi:hypothetical protein
MKYSKAAAMILRNFYRGQKVLMDPSDPNSVLVCIDNMLIVRFPDVYFPFNTGMFEQANLWKIIESVEKDYTPVVKTRRMITFENKILYEIFDEMRRSTYIDSKIFDALDFICPIFRLSVKSNHGPLLIYEEQFPDEVRAVILPVNIGV